MSGTTRIESGGLVTFAVSVNGSAVPEEVQIYSIHVEKNVNRISMANIVILDGSASQEKFAASSSSTFVPGNTISIEAGYDSKNAVIFKGIITKQTLRVDNEMGSALEVECKDESVKLTVGRKSLTFTKKKDSDVISSIIGTYGGIKSKVTATSSVIPEMVQYYCSDWDFILSRAEINGLIITTINGTIAVVKPDADSSPVLKIVYGNNMFHFNAELNAVTQIKNVKASSWDYKNQQLATGQAAVDKPGPGNLSSSKLADVIGLSDFQLQTTTAEQAGDLTNWSKAQVIKNEFSKIRGEVGFQGSSIIEPAKYITIDGMGERFDGDHLISGVVHDISSGNWITEATLGLSPIWFTQEPDVMAPPASGQLPGVSGLFNATVKKIYEDPDSEFRILIDIPLFNPNGEGLWARLSNFYSTNGAGVFFLPEVGDEVVVGFLNEDPRYPIILGSMYSSSKLKPFDGLEPNEKNSKKAIVTKGKLEIEFNDEDLVTTITTPNKNTIILSDKEKQISLQDENSNSIVLSSEGITISSPKNVTISADQNIEIKGNMGITCESSSGDVKVSGLNIKETAQMQYSAEGSLTAQVQGGTELTLKGAMVMIN